MFNDREVQQNSSYNDPQLPVEWLEAHPEVTDILFTGADPMVLKASTLKKYIEPITQVPSIKTISISTKSLAWWPYRFTTDSDSEELLSLFEWIKEQGIHLNIAAHFTHERELITPVVMEAIEKIRETGTPIRTQGPLIKEVNDNPEAWSHMWDRPNLFGAHSNLFSHRSRS